MTKPQREALCFLLPAHTFIEVQGGDHFKAQWTTPRGVFRADSGKWADNTFTPNNTRLRVFHDADDGTEMCVLRTEDPAKFAAALELLGAL